MSKDKYKQRLIRNENTAMVSIDQTLYHYVKHSYTVAEFSDTKLREEVPISMKGTSSFALIIASVSSLMQRSIAVLQCISRGSNEMRKQCSLK